MNELMDIIMYFMKKLGESYVEFFIGIILPMIRILFRSKFFRRITDESYLITRKMLKKMLKDELFVEKKIKKKQIIYIDKKGNVKKVSDSYKKQISIVEEMYYKNIEQYNRASIIICASIIVYYCINIFFTNDIKIEVLILLYVLFIFIAILRFLSGYRIKRGFYGTNYAEGKEILYYLAQNSDKNDNNTGKRIFNEVVAQNEIGAKIPANGEPQY